MSSRGLRLGLVGTGKITTDAHLPAALASPDFEVTAFVDPARERAADVARRAGLEARVAAELDEVLPAIDAALIATPNHTHAALAERCLAAGVHVLVEKPLANSVAEGEAIARAAGAKGPVVAVGYCTRFLDGVGLMKTLLERGFFGAVTRFAYQAGSPGGWASASGFTLDRSAAGGGVLVTQGTHFLDRLLYWFGPPERCSLEDDSRGGPEANAVARLHWDGLEGSVRLSKTTALPAGVVLETDRGRAILRDGEAEPIRWQPDGAPEATCELRPRDAQTQAGSGMYERQLADFARACRGEASPRVDAEDGLQVIRLVEDLYAHRRPMACDWYGRASD